MTQPQPGWFPDPQGKHQWRWWDGAAWTGHIANGESPGLDDPGTAAPHEPSSARRVPIWLWAVIGVAAIVPIILLSPVFALVALVVLITGIVALTKGSRTWLRIGSRKMAIGVTAGAAAVLLVTGSVSAAILPNTTQVSVAEAAPTASAEARSASPTPTPTPAPVATTRDEVVTELIAFAQVTVQDGAVPSGQTSVTTLGVAGEKALTYRVNLVDGVEVSRDLISEAIATAPIDEVTTVGTYVAPPPPPPPAAAPPAGNGCHPSYADACVPIDSDVDCAGGSGNGPSYFSGVARVVGPDVYDLDRDGDGYACEP